MKNRLIALLLCFLLLCPAVWAAEEPTAGAAGEAALAENEAPVTHIPIESAAYQALCGMNLLPEDVAQLGADDPVTRAQFVGALAQLADLPIADSQGTLPFTDVNLNTPHKDAIAYFYGAGLINGNGDNTFLPQDPITYVQAMKLALDLLGYRDYTLAKYGAYPAGYIAMAQRVKLTRDVDFRDYEDAVTGGPAMALLYNCALANLPEPISFSMDGSVVYGIDEDVTFLSRYRDILNDQGVLRDNGVVSLTGTASVPGAVQIDDRRLRAPENMDLMEYIGCDVDYFYQSKDGTDTLLCLTMSEDNQMLTLDSDDLAPDAAEYSETQIVYYDGNRQKIADLDKYADVVYNNYLYTNYSKEQLCPKMGSVRLIDNNGDRSYDLAVVLEYENLLIHAASTEGNFLSGKYGNSLSLDEYEIVHIWRDGAEISVSEVQNNRVASFIASPDKRYLSVYINGSGASETLRAVTPDGSQSAYTFDSGSFRLAKTFQEILDSRQYNIPEIRVGVRYQYYLDMAGKIAGIVESGNILEYAYLIDARMSQQAFAESGVAELKLVLPDGSNVTTETTTKMKIDGTPDQKGVDFLNKAIDPQTGLVAQQVIRVAMNNDGKVKEVDFADPVEDTSVYGYDNRAFTLDFSSGGAVFQTNNCYMLDHKYTLSGSTVCFLKYTELTGEVTYGVIPYSGLVNGTSYVVKIYDCDEYLTAGAIAIEKKGTGIQELIVLVDQVTRTLDKNGDPCIQLEGLSYGEPVRYQARDDGTIPQDVKRGDIVRVAIGQLDGMVNNFEKVCSLSEHPAPFVSTNPGNILTWIYGYLYSFNGSNLLVLNPDGAGTIGRLTSTGMGNGYVKVSIYDVKRDEIRPGEVYDLYGLQYPDSNGDLAINDESVMIFMYRRYDWAKDIIIIYY